ncbi:MAG: class I SAM-dependent methyltransferase [Anaerolineae bacterium]|nr:class I SAM-dependent methyltransferase [Anaerolineae bacterium]
MSDSPHDASVDSTPHDDPHIAHDAYQKLAAHYAALVDTKPHNAYYDRPAMLNLLPDVNGLHVLDAGCGTGVYAEWLLDHGATVTGVDGTPNMLAFARERCGGRADLRLHDLNAPLDFLADGTVDVVLSALVMHYLEDWDAPFVEFARVLKTGGLFVFSTGHPLDELRMSPSGNYFAVEPVTYPWRGFGGDTINMPFYRRPLSAITGPLTRAGFVIEQLVEPLPTAEFAAADKDDYTKLMQQPAFLCIRAQKCE